MICPRNWSVYSGHKNSNQYLSLAVHGQASFLFDIYFKQAHIKKPCGKLSQAEVSYLKITVRLTFNFPSTKHLVGSVAWQVFKLKMLLHK